MTIPRRPRVAPSDLMDTEELAELLGVKVSSLRAMRSQPARHRRVDGLPEPLRIVSHSPVWSREAIEAWMAAKEPKASEAS